MNSRFKRISTSSRLGSKWPAVFLLTLYAGSVILSYGMLWASDYTFQVDLCRQYSTVCYRRDKLKELRIAQTRSALISLIPVSNIVAAVGISGLGYDGLRYFGPDMEDFKFAADGPTE